LEELNAIIIAYIFGLVGVWTGFHCC
jgi:hypothetical protein